MRANSNLENNEENTTPFIARNHLVEEAIEAAANEQNFAPFNQLIERLSRPFVFDSADARLATPPQPEQVVQQTFCGT